MVESWKINGVACFAWQQSIQSQTKDKSVKNGLR